MVRAPYQRQCSWTAYLAKHLGRITILHARTVAALPYRLAARDDLLVHLGDDRETRIQSVELTTCGQTRYSHTQRTRSVEKSRR